MEGFNANQLQRFRTSRHLIHERNNFSGNLDYRYVVNDDGYPFEEYNLKTQDGYILKIHRIPGGSGKKCDKNEKNKPIVFLLHPLTLTSISWLIFWLIKDLMYGTFRQYDYGKEENLRKYGSPIPPDYPLEKVTVPMAIFSGSRDFLATPRDVELLLKELPNVVYHHDEPSFNHGDFALSSKKIRKTIYEKIVQLFVNMEKFSFSNSCSKSETFMELVENEKSKPFLGFLLRI